MDEQLAEQAVKELEKENLALKFAGVHKNIDDFRAEVSRSLSLILEQTSKTNGSVARATEKIHALEHSKESMERLIEELIKHRKGTSFWYTLQTNKWIAIIMVLALYALTLDEVRELIIKLIM